MKSAAINVGNVNALSVRNFAKWTLPELQSNEVIGMGGYTEIDYLLAQIKSPDQSESSSKTTNANRKKFESEREKPEAKQ